MNMKLIILIFIFFAINIVHAEEKKYTQSEFDQELDKRLKEEILRIKQKGIVELTNEILEREKNIRERERELKRREEEYQMNVTDFTKKIQDFDKKQSDFLACIDKQDQDKEARISKMVKVVSGMKPDKAAALIAEQDPELSVKILSLLETDKASKIFNMMEKEKSAQLQKRYLDMKR
jgi:flagellar motility protein MotE (MotC chaperone)